MRNLTTIKAHKEFMSTVYYPIKRACENLKEFPMGMGFQWKKCDLCLLEKCVCSSRGQRS